MLRMVGVNICVFIWVDDVHEKSGCEFDYQKLKHVLFAPVGEVLSLFPVCQLVCLLAVVKWKKMVNFLFVVDHNHVDLFIFHGVLNLIKHTLSRS